MLSFSRTEEFLASPCLLVSRLLWKQKEDSIMARPLHASGKLVLQTFEPLSAICLMCGKAAHIAYQHATDGDNSHRTASFAPGCTSMCFSRVSTLSPALSARGGRSMGVTTWGIWIRCDCTRRVPAVSTASMSGRDPSESA